MPQRKTSFAAACLIALLMVGCASQKEPAMKLIADAEATLAGYREEAAKFAPEQMKAVESSIASLKDKLQKGDYKDILSSSPDLTRALAALKETSAAKKAEFEAALAAANAEWTTLSTELPTMVEAIQARFDTLSKSRKLPKGLDPGKVAAAKASFDEMKASWPEATLAFVAGEVTAAAEAAREIKAKGVEVMEALGMAPPADGG